MSYNNYSELLFYSHDQRWLHSVLSYKVAHDPEIKGRKPRLGISLARNLAVTRGDDIRRKYLQTSKVRQTVRHISKARFFLYGISYHVWCQARQTYSTCCLCSTYSYVCIQAVGGFLSSSLLDTRDRESNRERTDYCSNTWDKKAQPWWKVFMLKTGCCNQFQLFLHTALGEKWTPASEHSAFGLHNTPKHIQKNLKTDSDTYTTYDLDQRKSLSDISSLLEIQHDVSIKKIKMTHCSSRFVFHAHIHTHTHTLPLSGEAAGKTGGES